MRFRTIFPSVFIVLALCMTAHAEPTASISFDQGVAALQKNDVAQARTAFQSSLRAEPDQENPFTLFNLGLVEQKAGKLGLAIALWRKALVLEPGMPQATHALTFTQGKLERTEIAHEVELWESFRAAALVNISLVKYLIATAALFLGAGWLLLRHAGRRQRARLDEQPQPGFPFIATGVGTLFVIVALLCISKAYDQSVLRGTIIEKKTQAKSSPDSTATPLFDLYEGLEVIVRQSSGDWTQVSYPGGSTGWVPKTAVLATTDKVVL